MNQQQLESFCDLLSNPITFEMQKKKVKTALKKIVKTMTSKQISYCNRQIARLITNESTHYSGVTAIILQMYCGCLEDV